MDVKSKGSHTDLWAKGDNQQGIASENDSEGIRKNYLTDCKKKWKEKKGGRERTS